MNEPGRVNACLVHKCRVVEKWAEGQRELRRDLVKELLTDLRRMASNIKRNEAQMRDAVAATTTILPQVHGISTVLTAKYSAMSVTSVGFLSADHFASYTGTSPLAASSGQKVFSIDSTPVGILN
ncbi:transposase [Rhodococcus globerulus]|uniref:transposase n=1 Tax=Rhodococcus globerulus TaxID=33008 RepID=UPI003016EC10